MPIKPPKCRTCGVEEYRHLCRGAAPAQGTDPLAASSSKPKKSAKPKKEKP